ncbi:MAG: HD domain-containing protein [Candidatus Micrarchaeota archaeon]
MKRSQSAGTADFLFQLGALKRLLRSGWLSIGIAHPESIAGHVFRTVLIGLLLAKKERADENKVIKLCLLHDLAEIRTSDLTPLNSKYIKKDDKRAARDVVKGLFCERELNELLRELDGGSKEAVVARDADALELLIQAKEYLDEGNKYAREFITTARKKIKTRSAKEMARAIENTDSARWWKKEYGLI